MKQASFEKALSKNNIGVVAVHVFGSSIDLGWLKKICKKNIDSGALLVCSKMIIWLIV